MIPAYDKGPPNCRFMGFAMSQNRWAVPVWSYFMEVFPINTIIEIGVQAGGLTSCLGLAMHNYGGRVFAFDTQHPPDHVLNFWSTLPISFYNLDVFSDEGMDKIKNLMATRGPLLLLCDGGNKAKEFKTFAASLKPEDTIAAHDLQHEQTWPWSEITLEDTMPVMERWGLVRLDWPEMHKAGWLAARKL